MPYPRTLIAHFLTRQSMYNDFSQGFVWFSCFHFTKSLKTYAREICKISKYLVIEKNIVSIFCESKAFRSSRIWIWVLYSKLTKFIQKIYPNSRMLRIFTVCKSEFCRLCQYYNLQNSLLHTV